MDYNNLLKNKTALVSAGANGIGYAIAKKFEESGAKVFVSVSYTHLTLPTKA